MRYSLILLSFLSMSLGTSAFAAGKFDDYGANAYKEEGVVQFKVRGFYAATEAKQSGFKDPTSNRGKASKRDIGSLFAVGYGVEGVTTVFFNDHLASEFGVGWGVYRVSTGSLDAVAYNYSDSAKVDKRKDVYTVPVTLTMQYHLAPFGAVRPYVGGGYAANYFFSKSKEFNVDRATGPVYQVGADIVMSDDTLFNLDARQYSLKPKVKYKSSFLGGRDNVNSTMKLNPMVISAGVGIKF